MTRTHLTPEQASQHLTPDIWAQANRHVLAKAISELAHELLVEPTLLHSEGDWGSYRLATDRDAVEYRFRARVLSLEHWWIDEPSLCRLEGGAPTALDAMSFIVELRQTLSISDDVLPEYLQELSATLYAAAHIRARPGPSAAELCTASFQEIETGMLEGHPCFVANNARIGFNAHDYPAYAPELGAPIALTWLAARSDLLLFSSVQGLSYGQLLDEELDADTRRALEAALIRRGLEPSAYRLLPVHPWQWSNELAQLFAGDLARGHLVYLGPGPDRHRAQQSIRTLFNVSEPHKRYVKTALSILNMGFTRGMAASIVRGAAVNDWVERLVHTDPTLQQYGFTLLREVAFAAYPHRLYERAVKRRADKYREMLAALWRENPSRGLEEGERLMTMAALMHIDRDGAALLPALIRASGLGVDEWLRRYLRAYMGPLLHCFFRHHLVFSPHSENVILVLREHAIVRVIIKDIAEDIGVLNPEHELPEAVRGLALRVPEEVMSLSIFTDVFDCVFRFLARILVEHADYPEASFWRLVAEHIREYEAAHPELRAKFRRWDLFAPTFLRNCLNRLQLKNNRMMVDLNAPEPVDSLQFVGVLPNPIAAFAQPRANPSPAKEQHDFA